nr:uncharacterized mitochondrial protein AtMg00810-like [Populus alba]
MRGFTQQKDIDYSETFSPVVKPTDVWLVLTIIVPKDGRFNNLISIMPSSMVHFERLLHGTTHRFCRLCSAKSCLSSSQVSVWSKTSPWGLVHPSEYFLQTIGFRASKVDTSLFILARNHDICYLLVYAHDILLIGTNSTLIHRLITILSSKFKLRDLGNAHDFLGVEVIVTSMGLMLNQHKYVLYILYRAQMSSCKPVDKPTFISKLDLSFTILFSDPTRFQQIVGALQYLMFTRSHIFHVVNKVCQFMHAPTESHRASVKCMLHYLKGTSSYNIHLNYLWLLFITSWVH